MPYLAPEAAMPMTSCAGSGIRGKGCDSFGPIGPCLDTADELGDPQNLDMWRDANGRRMQTGNTRTMIFGVAEIFATSAAS
jgi:2,4-diketo-3-deoxy-L-fuconate hydrolase